MDTGWYRGANTNLNKLSQLLGMGKKPSHGYTIAETAPEVVTAPGVYFPAEKGEVIPIQPRQFGGPVNNSWEQGQFRIGEGPWQEMSTDYWKSSPSGGGGGTLSMFPSRKPSPAATLFSTPLSTPVSAPVETPITPSPAAGSEAWRMGKPVESGDLWAQKGGARTGDELWRRKQMESGTGPFTSRAEGGPVEPGPDETPRSRFSILSKIISMVKPSGVEGQARMGMVIPPETTKLEQTKLDILKSVVSTLKPQNPNKSTGGGGASSTPSSSSPSPEKSKPVSDGSNPTGTKVAATGAPTPMDKVDQYQRQMTTMFSRQGGGEVYPPTAESLELEARKRWERPGYAEERLVEEQAVSPGVVAVQPGYERSYYETHPEERVAEEAASAVRPQLDMSTKLLEEARNRSQGYGLMGLSPRGATRARLQAGEEISSLTGKVGELALAGPKAAEAYTTAISRMKSPTVKSPVPHVIQTEGGPVWAYPPTAEAPAGSVLPMGVRPPAKEPTQWGLIAQAQEKGPDGRPTAKAADAQKTLDAAETRKLQAEMGGIPPPNEDAPPRIKQMPHGPVDESALDGLTEDQKGIIKGLTSYKYPWPGSFAMSRPKMQALIGRAEKYDPSFSGAEYSVRQKIRQSFTSGKEKDDIKGLNTATGHIDSLVKAYTDLENSNWASGNAAVNLLARHFPVTEGLTKRQGKLSSIQTKFNAVADEMAGIFKRSGATDTSIKQWREAIKDPTTATPEMWKGFINGALELMGSRISALRDIYESGMGRWKDFPILSKDSRRILSGLGVDVESIDRTLGEQGGGAQTGNGREIVINGKKIIVED